MKKTILANNIILYIENNIKNSLSIEMLSCEFNYSERHLRRVFTEITGVSLYSYMSYRKLVYILHDLKNSGERFNKLSYDYGYDNYDTFLRSFKNHFDITPTETLECGYEFYYTELVDELVVPMLKTKHKNEIKLNIMDYRYIYIKDGPNKISTYILNVNNSCNDLIKYKRTIGFNKNKIINITYADLKDKDKTNKLIRKFKKKRCLLFVVSNNPNNKELKVLLESLNKLGCLIIMLDSKNHDYNDMSKAIFKTVSLINNKNINNFNFNNLIKDISFENRVDITIYKNNFKKQLLNNNNSKMPKSKYIICICNNKDAEEKVLSLSEIYLDYTFEVYVDSYLNDGEFEVFEFSIY